MSIWLQKSASIQPRTSLPKFQAGVSFTLQFHIRIPPSNRIVRAKYTEFKGWFSAVLGSEFSEAAFPSCCFHLKSWQRQEGKAAFSLLPSRIVQNRSVFRNRRQNFAEAGTDRGPKEEREQEQAVHKVVIPGSRQFRSRKHQRTNTTCNKVLLNGKRWPWMIYRNL